MPLEPEPDLQWTAFLYISGELPAAEASSFEARLLDDQEARDAVAEAVEMAEALAIVGAEFQSRPTRRLIGRRVWLAASALAAAACLLLTSYLSTRPTLQDRPDASDVALVWSSLRSEVDAGQVAEIETESEVEVEGSTDRALPSWLLSAASAPLDDAKEEE